MVRKGVGRFLLICLGGAAGTAARYLLGGWTQRVLGSVFPFGTLFVNLIGSFLIAIIMYFGLDKGLIKPDVRVVLTTGVMGGFTTYSSFNYETMRLFQDSAVGLGLLYMAATVAGCLIAGAAGLICARLLGGA
jgi:CrcB protein